MTANPPTLINLPPAPSDPGTPDVPYGMPLTEQLLWRSRTDT